MMSSARNSSRNVILFLAANPIGNNPLALEQECAAIERELRMTEGRDDFDFRSKWAITCDDTMRHLNELCPTIIHFSGHGGSTKGEHSASALQRDSRDAACPTTGCTSRTDVANHNASLPVA